MSESKWQAGQTIENLYQVRGVNTEGGMSIVYFVWHTQWNMELVIKSPRPELLADQTTSDRFTQEAETWVNLGLHPNIVTAYYVRQIDGFPRIFLEKMDGGSLKAWLTQGKVRDLATALDIAIQIARGLAHAQSRQSGLVHRDLKPANILMTPDGEAKVSDFGLVDAVGSMVGTPAYMAPEMWTNSEHVGPAADSYSFGVMLYELLTGRRPFDRGDAGTSLGQIRNDRGVDGSLGALRKVLGGWEDVQTQASLGAGQDIERLTDRSLGETHSFGSLGGMSEEDLHFYRVAHTSRTPESPCRFNRSLPAELEGLCMALLSKTPSARPALTREAVRQLKELYGECVGQPYPRDEPREAELLADSLNNYAVSLLDLGNEAQAERLFDEALAAEPHHIEATYNRELFLWRAGKSDDECVRARLRVLHESAPDDPRLPYLIGWVDLERWDPDSAAAGFQESLRLSGAEAPPETAKALDLAQTLQPRGPRCVDDSTITASCIALSGDGKLALTATRSGDLTMWELTDNEMHLARYRRLAEDMRRPEAVALSDNARWAIMGSLDGTVHLWSAPGTFNQSHVGTLEGHEDKVYAVTLGPDGRLAFSASADKSVRVWDVHTRRCLHVLAGHEGSVTSLAVSADAKTALSGSWDGTLRVWDIQRAVCLQILKGHTDAVRCVALSADGQIGLSSGEDRTLRVWDGERGKCLYVLGGHTGDVRSVALTADGRLGLSASADKTLRLWDVERGRCLRVIEGHVGEVDCMAMTADGEKALSVSRNEKLRLWRLDWPDRGTDNVRAPAALCRVVTVSEATRQRQAFAQAVAAARSDLQAGRWTEARDQLLRAFAFPGRQRDPEALACWGLLTRRGQRGRLRDCWPAAMYEGHTREITSVAIDADGNLALSGSLDQSARLWDMRDGHCLNVLEGQSDKVAATALSGDGELALTGGADGVVRLWETRTGQCLRVLEGHSDKVQTVALSSDKRLALSAGKDCTLRMWDLATGACLQVLLGHTAEVNSAVFSRDSRLVLSASSDKTLRLWDAAKSDSQLVFEGHTDRVRSVAVSADGRLALSGGDDKAVRLWGIATGACLRTLNGHKHVVSAVALSADGRAALSGSWDNTVRLWDVATGEALHVFEGHSDWVNAVAFSADGQVALSGGDDKTVRTWGLTWDVEIADPADGGDGARECLDASSESPEEEHSDVLLDTFATHEVLWEEASTRVRRVRHLDWGTDLAMKHALREPGECEERTAAFRRECETWVALGLHPHLLSCHFVLAINEMPHAFFDVPKEGSLADWMRSGQLYQGGPSAALRRILDIAIQLAWALQHVHESGFIHQDVTPAIIYLADGDTAQLGGFGAADRQVATSQVSPGSDICNWAVTVLEMFSGEARCPTIPAEQVLASLMREGPGSSERPHLPEALLPLLHRCLSQDLDQRPRTMREVADAVREIHDSLTGAVYARSTPQPAEPLSGVLNNRSVSLLALGRPEEAERLLGEALRADPLHPEAVFNLNLLRWRQARATDSDVVSAVERTQSGQSSWRPLYYLALVHLARGAADEARAVLEEALAQGSGRAVSRAVTVARTGRPMTPRIVPAIEGHTDELFTASMSADGQLALSASGKSYHLPGKPNVNSLRVWEPRTGRCLRTLKGETNEANDARTVALSADGARALSGSGYGNYSAANVVVWDTATGRLLRVIKGRTEESHHDAILAATLTPDGALGLTGSGDKTAKLWDTATGRCLQTFAGHAEKVLSVALSVKANLALTGSADQTAKLWDLKTGRCLRTLGDHAGQVNAVALSADAGLALTGSADHDLRLWEIETGRCLRDLRGHAGAVESAGLSAGARLAISGADDHTTRFWDPVTGRCLRTIAGGTSDVKSVAFSGDGQLALSVAEDGTLRACDMTSLDPRALDETRPVLCRIRETAEVQRSAERFHARIANAEETLAQADWAEAGALLSQARSIAGYERSDRLLDLQARQGRFGQRKLLRAAWPRTVFKEHTDNILSVSLSSNAKLAVSGSTDGTLHFWDPRTGRSLGIGREHTGSITSVALSSDGTLALSGSHDRRMLLWDTESHRIVRSFAAHPEGLASGGVTCVALTAEASLAVAGNVSCELRLFDVQKGQCLRTLNKHGSALESVVFSPDGRTVLSTTWQQEPRLWELETGRCLRKFEGHTASLQCVCMSGDGRFALSGSGDGTLRLWEIATGRCVRVLEGHAGSVQSAQMSIDGRFGVSGGSDGIVRVWDIGTGRCLHLLKGHAGAVECIALSSDGRFALSGGRDKTVIVWEFDWEWAARESADWDEGARVYLRNFLTCHTPYVSLEPDSPDNLRRQGRPTWSQADWLDLLGILQCAGYGWLRPEGVRRELERTSDQLPPPPDPQTGS